MSNRLAGQGWETEAVPRRNTGRNKNMERETGFEPATSTLARSHSTTELLPLSVEIINYAVANPSVTGVPLGILFRLDNFPIAHVDDAIAIGRGFGIVGNHQHRLPKFFVGVTKHLQNDLRVF